MNRLLLTAAVLGAAMMGGCADVESTDTAKELANTQGKLGASIGFNYGEALMEFTVGKRDKFDEDMRLGCHQLDVADRLAADAGPSYFDTTNIDRISGMQEFRKYCEAHP